MQTTTLNYRKLDPTEVARAFPRRGQTDLTEYEALLRNVSPGDALEIDLDGLSVRAMKRRLGQAAVRVGLALKFSRIEDNDKLIFQVRPPVVKSVKPDDGRRRPQKAQNGSGTQKTAVESVKVPFLGPAGKRSHKAKPKAGVPG